MIDVSLVGSDSKLYSKDNVYLESHRTSYRSSRRLTKGRYYYETTHISGDNWHASGFITDSGPYIDVFPRSAKSATIYYGAFLSSNNYVAYQDLKISDIGTKYTFGIGIDIDAKQFLFRSNNDFRVIEMNFTQKVKYWQAFFGECTPGSLIVKDNISINFGEKEFKYKVPLSFTPMNRINRISCLHRNRYTMNSPSTLCLLIITLLLSY